MLTFLVYFMSGYYVNIPLLPVFRMMSLGLVNDSAWINYYCAVGFTFKDNTITNQKQTNFLGLIYWQERSHLCIPNAVCLVLFVALVLFSTA